jgi:hypothetical protein
MRGRNIASGLSERYSSILLSIFLKSYSSGRLQTQINKPGYEGPNITFGVISSLYWGKVLFDGQTKLSHTTVVGYRKFLQRYIRPR